MKSSWGRSEMLDAETAEGEWGRVERRRSVRRGRGRGLPLIHQQRGAEEEHQIAVLGFARWKRWRDSGWNRWGWS